MDPASLVYEKACRMTTKKKLNYWDTEFGQMKMLQSNTTSHLMLRAALSGENLLGHVFDQPCFEDGKKVQKGGYDQVFINKCWQQIKKNRKLHTNMIDLVFKTRNVHFPKIAIEDLENDKIPVFTCDIVDTDITQEQWGSSLDDALLSMAQNPEIQLLELV